MFVGSSPIINHQFFVDVIEKPDTILHIQIIPVDTIGSHRTGRLENITVQEVNEILGFGPNVDDDPDKVVNSWGFKAMGQKCAIWDYKGSHRYKQFSTYGSHEVFSMLFGNRYVAE